ncbi:GNAT family N-acetyltransferase [Nitratireductor sp. XY-223]|uniref:GNAT family N-acetyltransferase n=1 Tax=Nitratireductor sp. XY-223 TaxID=2561926 RepID=UPI00145B44B0|nr:GNAT family N-acetyltransferase [Nitratireductor sp. XY-223]
MLSIDKTHYRTELEDSFDFRSDGYVDLFERASAYAFQHPVWLDAFYRHLAPARAAEPVVLSVRRVHDGSLQCVVPMIMRMKRGFRLLEMTDLGVGDYASAVATADFWADLEQDEELQQSLRSALPDFDLLRARPVREEDCGRFSLLFGCDPEPLGFSAHAVTLARPFADWRKETLNGSLRKMIDRKSRKLRREHAVVLEQVGDAADIRQAIVDLAQLRSGRFEGDVIHQDFARAFYSEVAEVGAREGMASTWRLAVDGDTAGIVFGLTNAGRFYYLLIGCDYERFGQFSPGLQLYDGIMEDWSGRDGACFDFTIGDEDFKMKFGTAPTAMFAFVKTGSLLGALARRALTWRHNS